VAFTPYVTSQDLLDYMQVDGSGKQADADLAVKAGTEAVDEYCQRHFWQDGTTGSPVARVFQAHCWWSVQFGAFNDLTSISTLKTDEAGDGVFEVTWSASDYQLRPVNRPTGRPYTEMWAIAGRMFPVMYYGTQGRPERVEVTGVWGWAAVPSSVVKACQIHSARLFTRAQSPNGWAGVGDFAVHADRNEDRDVVALLNPYRYSSSVVMVA
jgi:hypothetical protein